MIKVSIVTVVFNGEKFLEQAMQSVFDQTYPNIEYLVIDGASTDGTLAIIQKHEKRLAYWESEPDGGMYEAMNKGILRTSGILVGMLNADDWYEPDAVEKAVRAYEANPDAAVIHGRLNRRDEDGALLEVTGESSDSLSQRMIEHPTCFIPRQAYLTYGGYHTGFTSAADYELMLRFRKKGAAFVFIDDVLANFRSGGVSGSRKAALETISIRYKYGIAPLWRTLLHTVYWKWIKRIK